MNAFGDDLGLRRGRDRVRADGLEQDDDRGFYQAMLARSSWPQAFQQLPAAEVTTYLTSEEVAQFNAEFSRPARPAHARSRLHDPVLARPASYFGAGQRAFPGLAAVQAARRVVRARQ